MKRIFFGTPPGARGTATPQPDPFGSDDYEIIIESIVDDPKVRMLSRSFLLHIKCPKYQDPMVLLLEYLAKVSALDPCCVFTSIHINSIVNRVACTTLRCGSCSRRRLATNSGSHSHESDCE